MEKAQFALATDDLLNHLCRTVVLQISHTCCKHQVSTKAHVLVASNSISLSCLEGRIYMITVLNPLPVLIILLNPSTTSSRCALKILRDKVSFTHSFMINTQSLVGCLENSDRKVKQFLVIPWIALSRLVYLFESVWF